MKNYKPLLKEFRYEIIIIFIGLFYYMTTPILFNYVDGVVMGTSAINSLFPHYPFLYPLIVQAFTFILGSVCSAFKLLNFIQLALCIGILIHAVRSVPKDRKKLTFYLLMGYSPIILFQFNIMSESIFISAEILLLSTIVRYLYKEDTSFTNMLLHGLAVFVLIGSRHIGILLCVILPFVLLVKYTRTWRLVDFSNLLKVSAGYIVLFLYSGTIGFFMSEVLNSTKVPLYGRPAMHVITETFRQIENSKDKETFTENWAAKAANEDEVILQDFILHSNNIWLGPREQFRDYVDKSYPNWSKRERFDYVEKSINSSYWHYLQSGNSHVKKFFILNFWNLLPIPGNTSVNILVQSHEGFYRDGLHLQNYNCSFSQTFPNKNLFFTKVFFYNFEKFSQLFIWYFLFWFMIFYRKYREIKAWGWALILFIFLYTLGNTVFTVPLPRYSIPSYIALIYLVISIFPDRYHFSRGLFKKKVSNAP